MRNSLNLLMTGGTGQLGKTLLRQLDTNDLYVDVLSRNPFNASTGKIRYLNADLTKYKTLKSFSYKYNIIVHCASNPRESVSIDVEGTRNLLKALEDSSVINFIYISIVGVGKSTYNYYQNKLKAEQLIINSGFPYTILRVTQFHDFVYNRILNAVDEETEFLTIPTGLKFQSIDMTDICKKIEEIIYHDPANSVLQIGGSEILTIENIVEDYQNIIKPDRKIIMTSDLSDFQKLFTTGINLCPEYKIGKTTWKDYLSNKKKENNNG